MIDYANEIIKPTLELERKYKATKKALRYATKHFISLQGYKVTTQDIQEMLANVSRIEAGNE